jgi:predicted metalloprotease with PDZ domain
MNVLVNRGGLLRNIEVKLTKTPFVEYLITDDDKAADSAKKNFANWLGK